LIVAWSVNDGELAQRKRETAKARQSAAYKAAPIVGDAERAASSPTQNETIGRSQHLRLAVPLDITTLQSTDPDRAISWRTHTRAAFEAALGKGYRIDGFDIDADAQRGFYLLARRPS
jgi:predicted GNAT superfamily acetyltransferase